MTLFYPYDNNGYYTGEPVEAETQPDFSSEWEPIVSPGNRAWFDGVGWRMMPALSSSKPLPSLKDEMYGILDRARFPANPKYTREEMASWPFQRAEAVKYLEDGSVGPYLEALRDTEDSLEVLAQKIIDLADAYDQTRAAFAAKVVKYRTQISNARKSEELPDPAEMVSVLR